MTSDTLTTTILREILQIMGLPRAEVATYTSHSMKATFLSWAGKTGLKQSIKQALGGHSKPGDRMVDLYSRDRQAEPLRQLGHVLLWVSSNAFLPDETRSGRWTRHPGKPSGRWPRAPPRQTSWAPSSPAMPRRQCHALGT